MIANFPKDPAQDESRLLDSLSTAVVSLDHELRVRLLNQAAESLFELSGRRSVGHPLSSLVPGCLDMEGIMFEALQTGQQFTQRKAELAVLGGTVHTVDYTITPVNEDEWPILLVEFHALDRYMRIEGDATLREHQEVTRQMLRGLAHEIKNPLGGIRGSAQLLHRELEDPELREYTNIVVEETDRLTNLVDRLLGPRTPPKFEPGNIHQILERVRKLIELEASDNLQTCPDYDPSIPEIVMDQEMMTQAVLNIVRNAMQSLQDTTSPYIKITTRIERQFTIDSVRHRNVVVIGIEDNGPGIPENLREQLFYPMITGRPDGTGLGLSVAHSIINRHQGLITFTSEPGQTRFTIYLPMELNHGE